MNFCSLWKSYLKADDSLLHWQDTERVYTCQERLFTCLVFILLRDGRVADLWIFLAFTLILITGCSGRSHDSNTFGSIAQKNFFCNLSVFPLKKKKSIDSGFSCVSSNSYVKEFGACVISPFCGALRHGDRINSILVFKELGVHRNSSGHGEVRKLQPSSLPCSVLQLICNVVPISAIHRDYHL